MGITNINFCCIFCLLAHSGSDYSVKKKNLGRLKVPNTVTVQKLVM